jgi:hypothetical protein
MFAVYFVIMKIDSLLVALLCMMGALSNVSFGCPVTAFQISCIVSKHGNRRRLNLCDIFVSSLFFFFLFVSRNNLEKGNCYILFLRNCFVFRPEKNDLFLKLL